MSSHPEKTRGAQTPGSRDRAQPLPLRTGGFLVALLLAVGLTWLLGYWIRQAEIVTLACQVTEAVPPIPAVATLLVLVLFNPLLRRLPGLRALSGGQIAVIYVFTAVATMMFGCAVVRFLIATLSAGHYYASPEAPIDTLVTQLPSWVAPSDPLTHKYLYEGSPSGLIPWGAWTKPILTWTATFLFLGGSLLGLVLLVADRWIDQERLSFPLVQLPLEIMGQGHSGVFFLNKAMWIGFLAAAGLNFYNATNAVFFGGPPGGLRFDFGQQTYEYPLAALIPFSLHLRPEVIGLGFLVSTDTAFSIWFSWFLHKLQALLLSGVGYRVEQMPFVQEQGLGAYLLLGVILLWRDRRVLSEAWRSLTQGGATEGHLRWGLLAAVLGAAGLLLLWIVQGLAAWLALVYLSLILLVALVYARARAETGVPLAWLYPFGQQQRVLYNFLGSRPLLNPGAGLLSPTLFAVHNLFSRGYFPTVAGHQIEGVRLGRSTGVDWRQISVTILLALAWGTVAAFIFHLQPYYERGAITLQGNIWGDRDAREAFRGVLRLAGNPQEPDGARIVATLFGAGFVWLLTLLRARSMTFPLNPIGYAVACSYGSLVWGPFFLVWLIKSALLHYGGGRAYQAVMPAFLGFALGHFITAGVVWGSLSATLGGIFRYWSIWFG